MWAALSMRLKNPGVAVPMLKPLSITLIEQSTTCSDLIRIVQVL